MSAQDIIEKIKALSPEDRRKVADFVRKLHVEPAKAHGERPDWSRIINEIFDEHEELFRKLAQHEAQELASSKTL